MFSPKSIKILTYFYRWTNYSETPGHEFAHEMARKQKEEKKFGYETKETSKNESEDKKEESDSDSGSNSSSSSSSSSKSGSQDNDKVPSPIGSIIASEGDSKAGSKSPTSPKEEDKDDEELVSNSDKELEDKANNIIKREKYKGPVERFVKKIGYGGKRVIKESVTHKFRSLFRGKQLQYITNYFYCKLYKLRQ